MIGFFTGVDTTGIVEGHASSVVSLQESQARTIANEYSEIRKELIERLSYARFDSFTAHRLRVVLAQINSAIDALNKRLSHKLDRGAERASIMSVEQLVKEIKRFDAHFKGATRPINMNILKSAMNTKDFLLNHYETSLVHYGSEVKQDISNALKQAVIQELPYSQVVQKIGTYFQAKEWEIHRLARTELHHIYSVAKLNGMKDLKKEKIMPNIMKALYHPMDSRTAQDSKELAEQNPIIPLNEKFHQVYTPKSGKKQVYDFLVPPNRPNDRAILIPYDPEWLDQPSRPSLFEHDSNTVRKTIFPGDENPAYAVKKKKKNKASE